MTMSDADTESAHDVLEPETQPSITANGAAPSAEPTESGADNTLQKRTAVTKAASKRVYREETPREKGRTEEDAT